MSLDRVIGRRRLAVVALVACLAGASAVSAAQPGSVLDQYSHQIDGSALLVPGFVVAQSFTAGRSGVLTDVVLNLGRPGPVAEPLIVKIVPISSGAPDGRAAIATESVAPTKTPLGSFANVEIRLSRPPEMKRGREYAIVILTNDPSGWGIQGGGSVYPRGEVFFGSSLDGPWIAEPNGDAYFETWVGDPFPPRGAYCIGTKFLDLVQGQPAVDQQYQGATPAIFVEGKGLTCDPPPPGYTEQGFAGDAQHVPRDMYRYWAP